MSGLELRELECFLVLAEELHFGRTGERLRVSQSRVSQLVAALERRVGERLVERTSRRVALTPLGVHLLDGLRPAHAALYQAVLDTRERASGVAVVLRLGFQGTLDEPVTAAIDAFHTRRPGSRIDVTELPLNDPFGALHRSTVDAAIVLLPVREPGVRLGPVFSRHQQTLAVSARHPFARLPSVTAEQLADTALIGPGSPAPDYWRATHAPARTPSGRPIPPGPVVATLQEALALVAADRGGLLVCRRTAGYQVRRDVVFVPVTGLPDSRLGLARRVDSPAPNEPALREFAAVLTQTTARLDPTGRVSTSDPPVDAG